MAIGALSRWTFPYTNPSPQCWTAMYNTLDAARVHGPCSSSTRLSALVTHYNPVNMQRWTALRKYICCTIVSLVVAVSLLTPTTATTMPDRPSRRSRHTMNARARDATHRTTKGSRRNCANLINSRRATIWSGDRSGWRRDGQTPGRTGQRSGRHAGRETRAKRRRWQWTQWMSLVGNGLRSTEQRYSNPHVADCTNHRAYTYTIMDAATQLLYLEYNII